MGRFGDRKNDEEIEKVNGESCLNNLERANFELFNGKLGGVRGRS
jgi:hypothetical protein